MGFTELLNKSLAAGWLILAVILLRFIFRRAPKMMRYFLWALVAVRLVCPISIESPISLVPSAETIPTYVGESEIPTFNTGFEGLNDTINPIIADSVTRSDDSEPIADRVVESEISLNLISVAGTVAMVGYMAVSYFILRRKVSASVHFRDKLWICDGIDSTFILGVIRPRIYLPSVLNETEIAYVEAHEMTHIKHLDHLWKLVGYVILAAYWWNPLVWVAYILFCRDIELCCDEAVIRTMEVRDRKAYSETLMSLSMPKRLVSVCPLAFGEVGVKSRVKSVLNYRKPAVWVIFAVLVATVAAGVFLLTDPLSEDGFKYDRIAVTLFGRDEHVTMQIKEGNTYVLPYYGEYKDEEVICTVESADPDTRTVVLEFDKPLIPMGEQNETYTLTMDLDEPVTGDDRSMYGIGMRTPWSSGIEYYFDMRKMSSAPHELAEKLEEYTDDDVIDSAVGDINRDGEYEALVLRRSAFSDHFSFVLEATGDTVGHLRTVFMGHHECELSFEEKDGLIQVKAVFEDGYEKYLTIEADAPNILLKNMSNYFYPPFPSYGDDKLSYSILVTPEARYKLKKDEKDKWGSKYFDTLEAGATLSFPGARDGEDVVFTIKEIDREQVTFSFSQTLSFGRDGVPVDELTMDFFSYDDAGLVLYDGDEKIAEYTISPAYSYNRTVKHSFDQETEPEPLGLYMFPQEVFDYAHENAAKTVTGDVDGDGRDEVVSLRYHPVMDSYNYGTNGMLRSFTISATEDGVGEYFSMFLTPDPDGIEFGVDDSGRVFVRYDDMESYFEIDDTQLTVPHIDDIIYIRPFYLNS